MPRLDVCFSQDAYAWASVSNFDFTALTANSLSANVCLVSVPSRAREEAGDGRFVTHVIAQTPDSDALFHRLAGAKQTSVTTAVCASPFPILPPLMPTAPRNEPLRLCRDLRSGPGGYSVTLSLCERM